MSFSLLDCHRSTYRRHTGLLFSIAKSCAPRPRVARAKLVDTLNVSAGTLNPHLPKRTITAAQILEWLEE